MLPIKNDTAFCFQKQKAVSFLYQATGFLLMQHITDGQQIRRVEIHYNDSLTFEKRSTGCVFTVNISPVVVIQCNSLL